MALTLRNSNILVGTLDLSGDASGSEIPSTFLESLFDEALVTEQGFVAVEAGIFSGFSGKNVPVFAIDFSNEFNKILLTDVNKSFNIQNSQDTTIASNLFTSATAKEGIFNLKTARTLITNPQPVELNLKLQFDRGNLIARAIDIFFTFSADAIKLVKFHYVSRDFVAFGMILSSYAQGREDATTDTVDIRLTSVEPAKEPQAGESGIISDTTVLGASEIT